MLRLLKTIRISEDSRIELIHVIADLNLVIMYNSVDKCSWILVPVLLVVLMRRLPGVKIQIIYQSLIILLHINCHTEILMDYVRMVTWIPMFYEWSLVWMTCMLQNEWPGVFYVTVSWCKTACTVAQLAHCKPSLVVPSAALWEGSTGTLWDMRKAINHRWHYLLSWFLPFHTMVTKVFCPYQVNYELCYDFTPVIDAVLRTPSSITRSK